MIQIAIFASGSGSNAANIADYFRKSDDINLSLIISNRSDAYVHERARKLGIPSFTFTKAEFDEGTPVRKILQEYNIGLVVLAGFLLKISQPLLDAYPDRIVNIHPALLPKYGGKGMYGDRVHKAVVAAGEVQSGITIHYVNEHYDEGDIIFQAVCDLQPSDTPEDVAAKVHQLEYAHFPEVIAVVAKKSMEGNTD